MRKLLFAFALLMMSVGALAQTQFVNLTPRPKSISVGTGVYVLPAEVTISTAAVDEVCAAEAQSFAEVLRTATAARVSVVSGNDNADIVMRQNTSVKNAEGYKVTVSTDGIVVEAATATGFFYALQTVKKIMPPSVMAGVHDPAVKQYTAPVCTIDDEPRFEYRGFMLDVSRHFFGTAQVKRMLDVMAYYKLNKFHWHLTDDQGWRVEIKKYPKLCTVGATRDFSWEVDPVYGRYQTYEPYGPFFYTQEQIKEVVEYASRLHIEVIPEVDMPGHFVAAMTAYPEFSCTPSGSHSVWTDGGISSDVLNVANPKAVQFAKDIVTELAALFPSENFHIGGDECPTTAWQNNADCQALYKELGLSNYRALQSLFIKQMSEHLKTLGKHVFLWNESITANGADTEIIKNTGATIMCWEDTQGLVQPGAKKAAEMGLDNIITPWGPYYINRVQSTDPGEPVGAGNGADTAERTYNYVPLPSSVPTSLHSHYKGVQGTFWCEHVGSPYLLEYLALPRLICIAEAGWTPQDKKDWNDFKKRWNEDYKILDYGGYAYGKHFLDAQKPVIDKVMPREGAYYRIVTTATDAARKGVCVEVLPEGSSKIGTGNAQAFRLWQMPQVSDETQSEYAYQWFTFEPDPSGTGRYAMVCMALPDGSVKPTPTATNNTGRWDYDRTTKHYAWTLGDHTYGLMENGHYKYTIHSTGQPSNMYMNAAAAGQQYSINQWSDPADGNGGIWELVPAIEEPLPAPIDAPWLSVGSVVRIENAVQIGTMLYADGTANLKHDTDRLHANAWQIVAYGDVSADGSSRTVQLKNVATGQYIANTATTPVTTSTAAADITLTYDTANVCWNLSRIVPIASNYATNGGCLATGGVYPQGAAWRMTEVKPISIVCVDESGQTIAEHHSALAEGEKVEDVLPVIEGYTLQGVSEADGTCTATYKRTAYALTLRCTDARGIVLHEVVQTIPVGESVTVAWPEYEFGTFESADVAEGSTLTLTDDMVLTATYATDALMGFAARGERVEKVKGGNAYLIYNAMPTDITRTGFLHAEEGNKALWLVRGISEGNPSYVWTATASGSKFTFGNDVNLWVGAMQRGKNMTAVESKASAEAFALTRNSDGTFYVKGNSYFWNANAGGGFTGWDGGHPYEFYTLYGQPYFYVTTTTIMMDGDTETSKTTESTLMKGGEDARYLITAATQEGYDAPVIEGAETLERLTAHANVTITYAKTESTGIKTVKQSNSENAYDLAGRKATQQSRVVIANAKKRLQ